MRFLAIILATLAVSTTILTVIQPDPGAYEYAIWGVGVFFGSIITPTIWAATKG